MKNTALWIVTGAAVVFLALILYVPWLRDLFSFGMLSIIDLLICLGAAIISIAWFEVFKFFTKGIR
jgi:Ca2+-transporting ATPase